MNQPIYRNILIYGTSLITVMGVSSILPVLPQLARELNISEANIGLFVYSFTLPGIFLAPVGGILADRYGRKAVLLPCLTIFALAGLGASFCSDVEYFIFWRILQGCGAACLGVLYTTIIGDIFCDDEERLKVMSKAAAVLSLGAAIFPALGGILGEVGWQWSMRLSLLALPIAILGFFTKLPHVAQKGSMQAYAKQAKQYILQKNALLHFALTFCAFCILYGPMVTYFPLFSSTHYIASPLQIGLLFAISSVGTAFATLLITHINKLLNAHATIYLGSFFFILCMLSLLFWPSNFNIWLLTIPIFFYGLGQGLSYPTIMSSLTNLAPSSNRGILMAVNGVLLRLAQSFAPFLCGFLFLWGDYAAIFSFGLIMAICMILLTLNTKIHRILKN